MIRPARFQDIPRIVGLIHDAAKGSIYARACTFDEGEASRVVMALIAAHGRREAGGAWCGVVDRGEVEGMLLVALNRVYYVAHELRAQDMFFFVTRKAGFKAGMRLLGECMDWCRQDPRIVEVVVSPNRSIGDPAKVERALGAAGFSTFGTLHRKELRA